MKMSTPSAPRRLAVFAPNWLGDAVMALPLIADLRRAWPAAAIVMAARGSVAPLFELVPSVDAIITLTGRADATRLASGDFDAALLLPNSFASAWLAKRAHIRERWGYARDLRGWLLTRAIPRPRRYGHQAEYYQGLGQALGVPSGSPFAEIHVSPAARAAAAALLNEHGAAAGRAYVVFAPGAAYGRAKQWPPARFAELARYFAADQLATVLVGAKGDIAACNDVARQSPAINLAGRTDLATLAGLFAESKAVIANDSGAMHLAAAAGVPVTAIFGPTDDAKTSPLRAAADAPAPAIVATDVWCRPCMLRECPIDHRCMTRITAERVHMVTRAIIADRVRC
jgi:heptosyltransferase-2